MVVRVVWLVLVLWALSARPAQALVFPAVDKKLLPTGVTSALWVRDYGLFAGESCTASDPRCSFSVGDAATLDQELKTRTYDEVWLASRGGDLYEGIKIGEVLRRHQATVRVPPGRRCVSACTVAFLGGLFRDIDFEKGATYEMHAGSAFMNADASRVKEVASEPERYLQPHAEKMVPDWRETTQDLFQHIQKALQPLGLLSSATENANRETFSRRRSSVRVYGDFVQLQLDIETIRREGAPAAQNILMRLEEEIVAGAIAELRGIVGQLGRRASEALDILDIMYTSRILGTAPLSYETALKFGIITKLVKVP